ncbi:MAG: calcium/proton exchanger [Candidatus Dormibacteraeota bacterium]|nr:calcium/proton exchanger [Candidatus Dormibacteraeota bacterium]
MRISGENRVLAVLLVFVPATLVAVWLHWPFWVQFFLSVAAVIPLAGFIGSATEELADRVGARSGGLLNATFGNAPDFLIGFFGIQRGLIPLVKATLIGALISNSALILGLCYIAAGLIHGKPRFRRSEAGHHSILMLLTVAAILFPSAGAMAVCGGEACTAGAAARQVQGLSFGIAAALLVAYAGYLLFSIFGFESWGRPKPAPVQQKVRRGAWPTWFSVSVLVLATGLLVPVVDTLTGTVSAVTKVLGWTDVFVGIVIVANAGNMAEAYAAISAAIRRRGSPGGEGEDSGLDLALGIASASSIQIATFILPLVVLASTFFHPMNLVFGWVEVAILGLLVLVFNYIAHDGESNWLEGLQLVVLYVMAAIVFYVLPVSAFGG